MCIRDSTFSAAHTGTGSGVAEAAQKAADGLTVNLRSGSDVGSFGEFIRVDLNGNYGELGSRMQSVVWTYYGDDSTYIQMCIRDRYRVSRLSSSMLSASSVSRSA